MLLHEILVNSANENKRKLAARCGSESITYGELDELSNKLCHCLLDHGVQVGDRVCIYLDKSINSLISIFGILKAGAVYVPLDPGAPHNRIETIINDSNPTAILSVSSKIMKIVDKLRQKDLLILFDNTDNVVTRPNSGFTIQWSKVLQYTGCYNQPQVIENDPAYILYTSGSTGMPKGVVISHRSSFVFVEWACNKFRLLPGDVISNHAPLHFDLSIFDLFSTIMSGGTIILISPEISLFPHNLASLISKSQINVWYSVPSMLVKMVLYGKLEKLDFSNLRLILFAGEVFPTKYLKKLIEIIPHASFYNLYGPTETNVCTYYKVDKHNVHDPLPIGKPCPYNRLTLSHNEAVKEIATSNQFDSTGRNVLDVGELCVQGPNVMSGYWGKENSDKLEQGLYHTGDLVKKSINDNYFIYLTRIDGMIKSRGYRIEIEEIESVLHNHPDIKRSVIVPVPDLESTNLLHAFIVPEDSANQGEAISEKMIKNYCSKYLPRYMVPAFITFCSEIPETHNGKVNRIKLKELAMEK
jgi:amino acid adenylation domain-containing protein